MNLQNYLKSLKINNIILSLFNNFAKKFQVINLYYLSLTPTNKNPALDEYSWGL